MRLSCVAMVLLVIAASLALQVKAEAQYSLKAGIFTSGGIAATDGCHRVVATVGQSAVYLQQVSRSTGSTPTNDAADAAKLAPGGGMLPKETYLAANYPNPFNPETWIPYALAEDSDVAIEIYDMRGRLVRSLRLGHKPAGFYLTKEKAAYWDGRNETGEQVCSGVYFHHMHTSDFSAIGKIVVLR